MNDRLLGTPRAVRLIDVVSARVGSRTSCSSAGDRYPVQEHGYSTRPRDIHLMPGTRGQLIRTTYVRQMQIAPSTYRWMLNSQVGALDWLMHQVVRPVYRRVLQMAAAHPLAMISTHPLGRQALGELRARGLIDVLVVTCLTDMSAHRAWVRRSVDVHLALHELAAEDARPAGAANWGWTSLPCAMASPRSALAAVDRRGSAAPRPAPA
jgi:processive 1,2-diacylglycerol beta-glucosyltransferase